VLNVAYKENDNKVVEQWLVATNINPEKRHLLFALEIKSIPNLQPSEKASLFLP
jgi:hypothetical protein